MLKVLLRSLPDVRAQLFRAVETLPRPVLVSQEHDLSSGGAFERRQPYLYLLEHQAPVSMVVIADDPNGGLWRDPVGDLAERTFAERRTAAEAATGYLLFPEKGRPGFVKRDLWDRWADVRALITRLRLEIPLPARTVETPQPRRGHPRRAATTAEIPVQPDPPPGHDPFGDDEVTHKDHPLPRPGPRRPAGRPHHRKRVRTAPPPPEPSASEAPPPPPPAAPPEPDPFAVLGLQPGAAEAEIKKAFRALIVQYHPDKVAHLAPEFRELAEQRTRALTEAYEKAQKKARGE